MRFCFKKFTFNLESAPICLHRASYTSIAEGPNYHVNCFSIAFIAEKTIIKEKDNGTTIR